MISTYTKLPQKNPLTPKDKCVFRPFVIIDLAYKNLWLSQITKAYPDALIDSGSDYNLAPIDLGKLMGISFDSIKPRITRGIGSEDIETYFCEVSVNLGGEFFTCPMGFAKNIPYVHLGGYGFFNKFQVKFNYPKSFEIKRKK